MRLITNHYCVPLESSLDSSSDSINRSRLFLLASLVTPLALLFKKQQRKGNHKTSPKIGRNPTMQRRARENERFRFAYIAQATVCAACKNNNAAAIEYAAASDIARQSFPFAHALVLGGGATR